MKKFAGLLILIGWWGCSHHVAVTPTVSPVAYQIIDQKVKEFSEAGGTCGGGVTAISGGMEQCLKNISIQMAEKIVTTEKIRATISRAHRRS